MQAACLDTTSNNFQSFIKKERKFGGVPPAAVAVQSASPHLISATPAPPRPALQQVTQHPETKHVLLRQYAVKLKKSGGRVPRTELTEMGPSLVSC